MAVKEGEKFNYDRMTDEFTMLEYIEDDRKREKAETIGYVAVIELVSGFKKTMYWTKEKMEAHADQYSQAFNLKVYQDIKSGKIPQGDMWKYSSFWYKNFDEMAFKTMIRQIINKWGILSIDMLTAYEKDMSVVNVDGSHTYIDNEQDLGSNKEIIIQDEAEVVDEETGEIQEETFVNANNL